ncbi:MAG TPA: hypothetical protein VNP73_04590 [Actinomycetota bacterium]|nr:hypothetical protein [Actinomycetota bacterium]
MRHLLKLAGTVIALMAFTTSAVAQECTPLPPKEVSGPILFSGNVRQSVAATYFQNNACNWNGNDGLNGTDAQVLDLTGIEGQAAATISTGFPGFQIAFQGIVLDGTCKKLGDTLSIGSSTIDFPVPYVIEVPAGAKWLIVQGSQASPAQTNFASQSTVTIFFEGRECEAPPAPPKKKKRPPR